MRANNNSKYNVIIADDVQEDINIVKRIIKNAGLSNYLNIHECLYVEQGEDDKTLSILINNLQRVDIAIIDWEWEREFLGHDRITGGVCATNMVRNKFPNCKIIFATKFPLEDNGNLLKKYDALFLKKETDISALNKGKISLENTLKECVKQRLFEIKTSESSKKRYLKFTQNNNIQWNSTITINKEDWTFENLFFVYKENVEELKKVFLSVDESNTKKITDKGKEKYNIGIITIVTEETQAVLSEFGFSSSYINKEGRFYYEKTHKLSNGKNLKIVHLQSTNQGNIPIVNAYQSMIRNYALDYVVLLGIAGSIKEKIKLCDVIIGTSVIYYEKKKESDKLHRRGEIYNITFDMTQFVNLFFVNEGEPASILSSIDSFESKFSTFRCPIGSGESVIANELSDTKRWLLEINEKTGVVETESAGFCQAFYETQHICEGTDIILVRGISDHADFDKDDKWRLPASKNAVIVLKKLLELIYIQ
jgi:adenosylhomocysteine nucleosidase